MSDQKAKEHRAKQTVNNLLLSLLATAGMVLVLILIVPRDDSSRIPKIDYIAIAEQATVSTGNGIAAPTIEAGWWSNQAKWFGSPIDAMPRFAVGFVSPKNDYIGMTHAFGVNPTWLALSLKDVVLEKNFSNPSSDVEWGIYRSAEVHDPVQTRDYMWVATVGSNAILLYGTAPESDFKKLSTSIENELKGN